MRKLVIFDRDNTLIEDKGHTYKIKDLKFLPDTIKALQYISKKKYKISVVTNQGGVAKGIYKIKDIIKFHNKIKKILNKKKVFLNFYFCPHHPDGKIRKYSIKCKCRKPGNLLIKKAQRNLSIKSKNCIMFGDKQTDKLAATKSKIKFYFRQKKYTRQIKRLVT